MKKILFVSPYPFHDLVGQAGNKTLNYYFSCFSSDPNFEVALAYLGNRSSDYDKMIEQYPTTRVFSNFNNRNILRRAYNRFRARAIYPFLKKIVAKYYVTNGYRKNRLISTLKKVKEASFNPEIIIVEFADPIYWIGKIKTTFPNSFIIASCHDVTYLSVERLMQTKNNNAFRNNYYLRFKNDELKHLNKFDLVVTHNIKDKLLLESEKNYTNKHTHVISPYYDTYTLSPELLKDKIIFFGAMGRNENIDAVEWFLTTVWLQLNKLLDEKIKFVIVGGGLNSSKKIQYLKYPNVEVTGFIDNPKMVFSTAHCFIIPLRLGAGIKVKVLEAMSSGIPVVTNDVGIEGIPVVQGQDYIHCNNSDEYTTSIVKLCNDELLQSTIAANARNIINNSFNLPNSYVAYKHAIISNLKNDYA
jgi:glycosyltransferase involved in cell wall biosynthesis